MPSFENKDLTPFKQVLVSFRNAEDLKKFAKLVNQNVMPTTKSIWFPQAKDEVNVDKAYTQDDQT